MDLKDAKESTSYSSAEVIEIEEVTGSLEEQENPPKHRWFKSRKSLKGAKESPTCSSSEGPEEVAGSLECQENPPKHKWLKRHKKGEKKPPIKIKLKTLLIILLAFGLVRTANYYTNRDFFRMVHKLKIMNNLINTKYIYKIPDKTQFYSNVYKAFINGLPDQYSAFLSKKEFAETGIPQGKELFGVGCSLKLVEYDDLPGRYDIVIAKLAPDSPMEKAGFLPGDVIVSVNGFISSLYYNPKNESLAGLMQITPDAEHIDTLLAGIGDCISIEAKHERIIPYNSNIDSIPGLSNNLSPNQMAIAQGSDVFVKVWRFDQENNQWTEYGAKIQKCFLPVCDVSYNLINLGNQKVGYIRLKSFGSNTNKSFEIALNRLLDQKVAGIVLDLRGNPGGNVEEFEKIATQILDKGVLYSFSSKKSSKTISATGNGFNPKTKNVGISVVVNSRSASCAEMLAACLQSHKRGKIVGEPTFGKGTSLFIAHVGDGDYMAITDAVWHAEPGRKDVYDLIIDIPVEVPYLSSDDFGIYGKDQALTTAAQQALKDAKELGNNNKTK